MQRISTGIRPFIGTKSFYVGALSMMVPVIIQQLINNLFNMVDNLMVGSLDINGLAMSAVTVANKPYIIFFGLLFGMTGAGGLMLSQYYGANNRKICQGLFSMQMLLGLSSAFLFAAILYFFPSQVMRIFVTDERTVALGVQYLKIVCFSYVPVAFSSVCIFSMRAIGENKTSMKVSIATMGVNAICNYVLIFGKLGFPAMGVEGAALGTVIARLFEMAFYLSLIIRKRMYFTTEMMMFSALGREILRTYMQKAVPLIFNELLWTVGISVYFWSYAHLSEAAVPAITISEQCGQIAAVMAMGTSSAVSVLIGAELGANALEKARDNCKKLLSLVVMIGLTCTALNIVLGFTLPYAFTISGELRAMATQLTIVSALFAPLNFIYAYCFFCLRAGGDTKNAMLLDSGYMWLVPVPVSIALALLFPGKLSVIWAMLIVQFLMNIKVVAALKVLKRGKWVRNITVSEGA